MEIKKMFLMALITIVISVMAFGSIWTYNLANGTFTVLFEMDDETRDYLIEHDYCIFSLQESYESDNPSYTFMGDCQYLNSTIIKAKFV